MSNPRFLVVRFAAIGDCVMAAWTATAIRNAHPEAFLCWAVQSRCAPVIDRQELASRVIEFPRERWKRSRWSPKTWAEQVATYARLRGLGFDYGIDLQGHSKTALCLRIAAPKKRISARATDALAARLNPVALGSPEGKHMVEWNHEVLCQLGEYCLPERPIMPVRDEAWTSAREKLGEGPLATISTGTGEARKIYPAEKWKEVASGLRDAGFQVAFIGGPTDPRIEVPGTLDLVGKMPLDQSMELVSHSQIHLAGDTGTGHMAAAYGVPVVSVFGPTNPSVYRPFTKQGVVVKGGDVPGDTAPSVVLDASMELMRRIRAELPH